jgi:general secretion pathway protein G
MARRRPDSRVFFPWERKAGPLGLLGRTRGRLVIGVVVALVLIVLVRRREERLASIRATRATITTATRAVASYRADHNGTCPRELGELVTGGYASDPPIDAWGRPLRVTCPGRKDPRGFDVSSDGPDGLPGGLDRVE